MDLFSALSDPTRRSIVELLAGAGPLSASELCDHFTISPPAISQHLKILREANLVVMEKRAQFRIYRVNPESIQTLQGWVQKLTSAWEERFSKLDEVLQEEQDAQIQLKGDQGESTK